MSTDELFAEMERLEAAGATPGPFSYRPYKHDDWGLIRISAPSPDMIKLGCDFGMPHCSFSISGISDEELNKHREADTDPVEANAKLYVLLRNYAPGLIRSLRRERDALAKRVAELEQRS